MTQVFRGRTLAEARRQAVDKLGRDAVVVSSRTVARGGLLGVFGGEQVEIAAAAGAPDEPPSSRSRRSSPQAMPFSMQAYRHEPPPSSRSSADDIVALRSELRSELRAVKSSLARPGQPPAELLAELAAVRETLEALAPEPKKSDRAASMLRAMGIDGPVATAVARSVKKGEGEPEDRLRDALGDVLRAGPWPLADEGKTLIAAVGLSGVGKTTTLAKLAARAVVEGRTVLIISCDTFRVGAVEQMRRYASLLDVEFAVAKNAAELGTLVTGSTADVVIVDTSGTAPEPGSAPMWLAKGEIAGRARHVLLCLPAAARDTDVRCAARKFAPLRPTALTVTKLDETEAPAGLVYGPAAAKLPVSVLCFGQHVPDDVAPATRGAMLDYFFPCRPAAAASTK